MGLRVQQQSQRVTNSTPIPPPMPKNSKSNSNNNQNRNSQATKFVGVRQRPSGKWVAEIKNTTQKIRMWLGTYDSAEEAARAYDAAAFLLRGSKTRSNFVPSVASTNSPLSLKIKNLLMRKRGVKPETPVGSSEDDQLCGWSRGEGASCCSEDELKDWVGGFGVGSRLLDRSGIDDDDQGKLRMASDPTDDGLWDLPHLYQLFFHS